eukprot:172448_1
MSTLFAWDMLLLPDKKKTVIVKIEDRQIEKEIFYTNGYENMYQLKEKEYVYIQVQNRGATKELIISETFHQEEDYDNESQVDLNIRIDSWGISLIDQLPQELVYISGDKLQCNLSFLQNERKLRFILDSFQVDNQTTQASSVLLVGLPTTQYNSHKHLPWLDIQFHQSSSTDVQMLTITPQKLAISVDGQALHPLMKSFQILSLINSYLLNTTNYNKNLKPIYFGMLFLAPMEFIVSFTDIDELFIVEEYKLNNQDSDDDYETMTSPAKQYLKPLLTDNKNNNEQTVHVTNIYLFRLLAISSGNGAVIRVSGYAERDRVFDTNTLMNRLRSHYIGELTRNIFSIVGSLPILGNIAGFTNSVRSGLQDFWYEPQKGITPGEVFKNFGKGTYSLLQKSIQGVSNSVSSLTSALGTGLAYASGDNDFAKQRSRNKFQQSNKPKDMADGIFKGTKKLALHTWDGVSGIWKDPIQGGQEDGVKGAIAGFGQGVMGLICKPLVGVMDLGSDLVSGIGNTLPSVNDNLLLNVKRKRKARMFYSHMKLMKEYKYSDALIKENLNRIRSEFNNSNNNNNNN